MLNPIPSSWALDSAAFVARLAEWMVSVGGDAVSGVDIVMKC